MILLVLAVLLVALSTAAARYDRWATGGPFWGADVLWLLAVVVFAGIIVLLVNRGLR